MGRQVRLPFKVNFMAIYKHWNNGFWVRTLPGMVEWCKTNGVPLRNLNTGEYFNRPKSSNQSEIDNYSDWPDKLAAYEMK